MALLDLLQKAPRETLAHFLSSLTSLVRNMTERNVGEEQAKRMIQTEAEMDRHRALSNMVAGVAHELNTPLGIANTAGDVERYAYPNGAGRVVEITLNKDSSFRSDAFAIAVRDDGAGMTQEQLRQVFGPFFTTGRGKGGTGLGMSLVKSLVSELIQGEVQINSTPGEGTTA